MAPDAHDRVPLEPHEQDRVQKLREEIKELNATNRNLTRQTDRLRKDLYESHARVHELEKGAQKRVEVDDVPMLVDEPALAAARARAKQLESRVKQLEARLNQQIAVCKDALAELLSTSSEVEVARIVGEDGAKALAAATRERDDAIKRATKAEAALAASQRALAQKEKETPAGDAHSKPATPMGVRAAGNGLLTPDTTVRPTQHGDAHVRDLQERYDGLLAEKRSVELKYLQLQRKWSDFKELVHNRLSPQKPRRSDAGPREPSPSPRGDDGDHLFELGMPAAPRIPNAVNVASSSPAMSVPVVLVRKPTRTVLPVSPASLEIVETSETEDEDWDGQPVPSRTVTPAQVSPATVSAQAPSTPRRRDTMPHLTKRQRVPETILVADSSPEKMPPGPDGLESQTQSQSSRGFSAPPESPVRRKVTPNMRKRKAGELSDDEGRTPRRPAAAVTAPDYAAFKGRGRYNAQAPQAGAQGINAQYEINREQNDGFSYQFDEVVRNKQKRRRLDGGDCECCRDYYEAIGPLPPRPQPPRWRSETPTSESQERGARPCRREGAESSDAGPSTAAAIAAHKNEISRHRHQWAPAATPPDYWHIGFPTTQEVDEINRKAAVMHHQKEMHVAAEASKPNGKYKKKAR